MRFRRSDHGSEDAFAPGSPPRRRRDSIKRKRGLDNPTLFISLVYSAAWGLMLLNGGLYWDDWCMVGLSKSGALLMGDMAGQLWQPYYWLLLDRLPSGWYVGHALTFLCYLASTLLLNRLLRRTPGLDAHAAVLIPAIFAVFPVNAARLAHIDLQYAISVTVFFWAWYLLVLDFARPKLSRRVFAALLLVFSMVTTKSLLLFSILIALHIWWLARSGLTGVDARRRFAIRYAPLLPLPVLAWLAHMTVARPWGPLYGNYNAITASTALTGLEAFPVSAWSSLVHPIVMAAPIALLSLIAASLIHSRATPLERTLHRPFTILGLGLAAFVLAVVPYLVVGKVPQTTGPEWWDSRHQLLVPFGAAFVVYGLVMLLAHTLRLRRLAAIVAITAFLAVFVVADIRTVLMYQADWYRQIAIMQHMKRDESVRTGNVFIVRDDAVHLSAYHRRLLPYEYSGMMYSVFGDATRFAVDETQLATHASQQGAYAAYEQYHWTEYRPPVRRFLIQLLPGKTDIADTGTLLSLMWQERFAPPRFDMRIGEALEMTTAPADTDQ